MSRLREVLRRRADDSGMTLTELIVSMGIFSVVVVIFMSGVVVMTKNTARAQVVGDSGDTALKIFQKLDKEVRYSSGVNAGGAGATAGTYYVEYLITAVEGGTQPKCVQWRYSSTTRKLERRSWPNVATPTATAWLTMATNMRNDLSVVTDRPFTFTPADSVNLNQRLAVHLDLGKGAAGGKSGAMIDSVFVARNTSSSSQSNAVTAAGANVTPVCNQLGRP
ncbi:PulJ/GspJ family protein [Cellulomonas sp. URHB0016]